jgi:hypothetical protein
MKPAIFLRIAAALTFIHAVLHTIGGVFGKVPPGLPNEAHQCILDRHSVTARSWV